MGSSAPNADQVRAALGELLSWAELVRSPQLSKFLNHIVDAKLRGEESSIKAYSIAVDVFGRPPTFDPQTDPIVRVQARRLRGLLQEYYRQGNGQSPARITLPVGRYVPEFELIETAENESSAAQEILVPAGPVESPAPGTAGLEAAAPLPPPRPAELGRLQSLWAQGLAAVTLVLLLGALIYGLQLFNAGAPPPPAAVTLPAVPRVYLSSYTTPPGLLDVFSARLADQMGAMLARQEDMETEFDSGSVPLERRPGVYLLSGSIVPSQNTMRIDSMLTDAVSGEVVWGNSIVVPRPGADDSIVAAMASRKIVRALSPPRGPLHDSAMQWLDRQGAALPGVSRYTCLMAYHAARELLNELTLQRAIDCYDRLLAGASNDPLGTAIRAWLEGRRVITAQAPGERIEATLDGLERQAERARRAAPGSSLIYLQLASIQLWANDLASAQRSYAVALGFNPLNTDARAGYAVTFALLDQWGDAARQAQMALADTPAPASWYYMLPALLALRAEQYDNAIEFGRRAAPASELGLIAAVAAAGLAGDRVVAGELAPLLLGKETLKQSGILPWLRAHLPKKNAVDEIGRGLIAAGVSEAALTGPF